MAARRRRRKNGRRGLGAAPGKCYAQFSSCMDTFSGRVASRTVSKGVARCERKLKTCLRPRKRR